MEYSNREIEHPLVSIILPMFNTEEYILATIKSIQMQTYTNWELLIVDDCSTDNSLEIAMNIAKDDNRIVVFRQNLNKGAAMARNKAIKKAHGTFLAFIDSDDIWKRNKLTSQIEFMEKNEYPFTCTYYGKIDEFGNKLHHTVKSVETINYNYLLTHGIGNSTVIYNAKILGKNYVPDIRKRNDYLMWLIVIKKANTIRCLRHVYSFHRLRKGSISANKKSLIKYHWRIYRKYEKFTVFKSIVILLLIIMNSMKNNFFRCW